MPIIVKILVISLSALAVAYFTFQFNGIETPSYRVLKIIDDIEIRSYDKMIYASYTPKGQNNNSSFRTVADFIFGSNNKNEKIAMTAPVVIKPHNSYEMAFIMPKSFTLSNLPKPNNEAVKVYEVPATTKAVIGYSGYTNNNKEKKYISQLKNRLEKNNIKHLNDFEVQVYDPPYKPIGRKNEITVSLVMDTISNLNNMANKEKNKAPNTNTIHLGGGCFWCIEAVYENIKGVVQVVSGYSGGDKETANYKDVCTGKTKHAEVCKITYNVDEVSLETLLNLFFTFHDPTTKNRQGNDIGPHYRSVIFYKNDAEQTTAQKVIDAMNSEVYDNKIVTELSPLQHFYEAENYHQDYFANNKSQSYCQIVIAPKVAKLRAKYSVFSK